MSTLQSQDVATPPLPNDTRLIPLTQGKFAIVDAADYDWLSQWKWYACYLLVGWRAKRNAWVNGKRISMLMHRQIIGAPSGVDVDHINGDGLINTRSNLRLATSQQNGSNRGKGKNNTSGYKGVTWHKRDKVYQAQICCNRKNMSLGSFSDPMEAARAYDRAAIKYHKEFARLNFPLDTL